jgi:hypothetical protein
MEAIIGQMHARFTPARPRVRANFVFTFSIRLMSVYSLPKKERPDLPA